MAAMFAGTLPEPPTPTACLRDDKIGLFYRGQYNTVIGDPECGKTLLTDHATVAELKAGGRVLRLDLDHNGPQSTGYRLSDMGADPAVLGDKDRFAYIEPEDRSDLYAVVEHMKAWKPTLVIIDSIGELLPMFGHSSNSADDFTVCHSAVIKPLVRTGACVVGIDHLSKGSDSRAYGAGGTMAKKRAIGGTSIRVTVDVPFTPGKGGSAYLAINKDRHGGLRAHSPVGDKEPSAGKFMLWPNVDPDVTGTISASVKAPMKDERNPAEAAPAEDIAAVAELTPPPTSANDAQKRLKWRADRARAAFKAWRLAPKDQEGP
ncbi:AAA family ATPase [Nocardia arizonensis]|uniref:AAA family ATPase n=2 Tax=Nocardia arizonensis TaxID=1141647 RepID=UPI0006D214D5|nr:AAA family ATPase [Nocardia arizonensis]